MLSTHHSFRPLWISWCRLFFKDTAVLSGVHTALCEDEDAVVVFHCVDGKQTSSVHLGIAKPMYHTFHPRGTCRFDDFRCTCCLNDHFTPHTPHQRVHTNRNASQVQTEQIRVNFTNGLSVVRSVSSGASPIIPRARRKQSIFTRVRQHVITIHVASRGS